MEKEIQFNKLQLVKYLHTLGLYLELVGRKRWEQRVEKGSERRFLEKDSYFSVLVLLSYFYLLVLQANEMK